MSVKEYNPYELEKPVINLGAHGAFTLGDITDARQKQLAALLERIEGADESDPAVMLMAICDLVEAAAESGAGISAKLQNDYRDGAIGLKALTGLVGFVSEWLQGEQSAGEG